jgi:hypothetical protein
MKMKYNGTEERQVPGYGLYKPGDEVEYEETLFNTGLFDSIKESKKKEGDN